MSEMDKVDEFIGMHEKGLEACTIMFNAVKRAEYSVGDIALGCLYLLRYYQEKQPSILFTAKQAMALARQTEDADGPQEPFDPNR